MQQALGTALPARSGTDRSILDAVIVQQQQADSGAGRGLTVDGTASSQPFVSPAGNSRCSIPSASPREDYCSDG